MNSTADVAQLQARIRVLEAVELAAHRLLCTPMSAPYLLSMSEAELSARERLTEAIRQAEGTA